MVLGLVIGIGSITPGLSGGALAAAFGLYEPIIKAVSHPLHNLKENLLFLAPVGVGMAAGIIAFGNAMEMLMRVAPNHVKWLFLGLVAGSLPELIRTANANGFRLRYLLYTLLTLLVVFGLGRLQQVWAGTDLSVAVVGWKQYFSCGLILGVGTIVPGISVSFILMSMGVYDDLLGALAHLDLHVLLPVALGFGVAVVLLVRLVENLFDRFHSQAYYSVLGLLLGSALIIFPQVIGGWSLIMGIGLFLLGIVLSLLLLRLGN